MVVTCNGINKEPVTGELDVDVVKTGGICNEFSTNSPIL